MAYVQRSDVTGKIPPEFLTEALDDDGDGQEDAGLLNQLIATASNDVDAYLAGIYSTPFADPAPSAVTSAAIIFTCEAIYARRLTPDAVNPFGKRADEWRDRLQKIGERKLPLDAGSEGAPVAASQFGSAAAIPMRTTGITYPPTPTEED